MTFEITIDDGDDFIIKDYVAQSKNAVEAIAHNSIINMISNDYADAAAYNRAMEEYRKNPDDVWSHEEVMRYYGLA